MLLREWCNEQVVLGVFPPRVCSDRRGRPRGLRNRSLGFLDQFNTPAFEDEILSALSLLTPYPSADFSTLFRMAWGVHALDLPLHADGTPNCTQYASQLGRHRVEGLGDMDYYLLARWAPEFRERVPTTRAEANHLNKEILKSARAIRAEMLAKVQSRRQP